jgi:kynurenine formamidase
MRTHEDLLRDQFRELSNWGRWGPDDELGTLNLITPETRRRALGAVRHGITVGCARPILVEGAVTDAPRQPLHFMFAVGDSPDAPGAADFIGLVPHGSTISHVDALAHIFWEGRLYNGRPASAVNAAQGATVCSVDAMKDGIVTRGVLLDIAAAKGKPYLDPGGSILVEDLEGAEQAAGLTVTSGDALLVRTGAYRRRLEKGPGPAGGPYAGLDASTLPWLRRRDVAVLATDAVGDATPPGGGRGAVHVVGIAAMGLCVLDGCQFEDLTTACAERRQWDFLLFIAPLRFRYATGSPVTPVALL